ncbi:DNA ligase (ATP) [Salix suchowensis]|nr:DNA ligase (ATP) [Salix suchowensis]
MEMVLERQRRQNRKERKERKEKEKMAAIRNNSQARSLVPTPPVTPQKGGTIETNRTVMAVLMNASAHWASHSILPDHRLTLQEIYDWITIVHPYFKRGETTWMNSIRHVLSTTAVFRKVPRERTVGRSFWAIWDEDMPCFKDGGFKKHLCKDMNGGRLGVENPRARARKRNPEIELERKAKKVKREKTQDMSAAQTSAYLFPAVMQTGHPVFPISHATPCHQPYLQSCMSATSAPQSVPSDIIFPPLPPTSAYHQLKAAPSIVSAPRTSSRPLHQPPVSRIPELTPNRSSSPTPSAPPTDDVASRRERSLSRIAVGSNEDGDPGDSHEAFKDGSLRPVQDWSRSSAVEPLQPGLILNFDYDLDERELAGNRKQEKAGYKVNHFRINILAVLIILHRSNIHILPCHLHLRPPRRGLFLRDRLRFHPSSFNYATPKLPAALPVTPPQSHRISPTHTPLSHKGLHMSPNASLAHYKSNLDPPPTVAFNRTGDTLFSSDENSKDTGELDIFRTPQGNVLTRKPRVHSTPLHLRNWTPTSRGIFDPHDPSNLLDDELSRLGAAQDSPAGLFGKSRSALLYESPNLGTSPGSCPRWW